MICIDLKKRIGLLKHTKERIPRNKLVIVAEAIFNSKLRYGIAVYISPVFNEEDLKLRKLPKNTSTLQILQNNMIRVIFGLDKKHHINMEHMRTKLKMMSINQMAIYHTLLEAHNVMRNSASGQIKSKWVERSEYNYPLRSETKNQLKSTDG